MMAVADSYDMIGFDLDGVIYRGPDAVPNAAETIAELRKRGIKVAFVTNNAQRSPDTVADHLTRLGIPSTSHDVVTSAQATARIMAAALIAGSEVLIVGSTYLADEIDLVGLNPVWKRTSSTAAICLGFEPRLTWADLNEGCYAVQAGAVWYACNNDYNRPTQDGLAIGMGGVIEAMTTALPGLTPIMGGKPSRALFDETIRRVGSTKPLFVGDRLDTDVEGANNAEMDSMFVLSGSHTLDDLAMAGPMQQPTYIGDDISALLKEPRHP